MYETRRYLLASTLMVTQQFFASSDTLSSSQLAISCPDRSSVPEDREQRHSLEQVGTLHGEL